MKEGRLGKSLFIEDENIGDIKARYLSATENFKEQAHIKISPTEICGDITLAFWRGRQSQSPAQTSGVREGTEKELRECLGELVECYNLPNHSKEKIDAATKAKKLLSKTI